MRVDNQTIFKSINGQFIDEPDEGPDFSYIRFGGNYVWNGGDEVFYRYYGDIYIDGTFARVALGDKPNYEACDHLELQVPNSWNETEIEIFLNVGSISSGDTAYLFVLDEEGVANSSGYPIVLSGEDLRVSYVDPVLVGNNHREVAYPNPVIDYIYFNIAGIAAESIRIKIYNILGKQVAELKEENPAQTLALNCANLPTGTYYYQIVCIRNEKNNYLNTGKFLVVSENIE